MEFEGGHEAALVALPQVVQLHQARRATSRQQGLVARSGQVGNHLRLPPSHPIRGPIPWGCQVYLRQECLVRFKSKLTQRFSVYIK